MKRPGIFAAAVLPLALFAGAVAASEDAGDAVGRYALDVFQDADGGGGAFVTDTVTGATMFCTPRECRRLAAPSTAAPAAQAPTVRRGIPPPPPDFAPPPAAPAARGPVNPAFDNF